MVPYSEKAYQQSPKERIRGNTEIRKRNRQSKDIRRTSRRVSSVVFQLSLLT